MVKQKIIGFFEKFYLLIILAILYAPIILLIVYSFSNSSNFNFDNGFSFEAYISIFPAFFRQFFGIVQPQNRTVFRKYRARRHPRTG